MGASSRTVVLLNALGERENRLAREFHDRVQTQSFTALKKCAFIKSDPGADPAIALAICDYQCSAGKCAVKFAFLRCRSYLPTAIVRPLRYGENGSAAGSFLVMRLTQGDGQSAEAARFFTCLSHSSFIACSPAWRVHGSSPLHKVARAAKLIIESPHAAITERSVAKTIGWSPSWLSTRFHREMGIKLERYVVKMKMCRALWQVISTDKSLKDICFDSGYANPGHFSRFFSHYFGECASSLRRT